MRILVVSDTHGDSRSLHKALLAQPSADVVIHLGDGADDVTAVKYDFPNKMFVQVKGNCDFGSSLPLTEILTLEGKKIFSTHGHAYDVKWEQDKIISAAQNNNADILLFGHTHIPTSTFFNGLHILNPGSLKGFGGTYGYIDISHQGVFTNIVKK